MPELSPLTATETSSRSPQILTDDDGLEWECVEYANRYYWVVYHQNLYSRAQVNANMFYPERNTLAFSETLLVPGVIVAPLHWLGVGSILIYNLVFLSGFALSGVGVALLVVLSHEQLAMPQ